MHTARHALGHTRHDDTTEKTASVQSERRPERAGASMPPRTRAFAVGPGPAAASMSPVLYSRATLPSSLAAATVTKFEAAHISIVSSQSYSGSAGEWKSE